MTTKDEIVNIFFIIQANSFMGKDSVRIYNKGKGDELVKKLRELDYETFDAVFSANNIAILLTSRQLLEIVLSAFSNSEAKINLILDRMQKHLPQLIKAAEDFHVLMTYLNSDQRTEIYSQLKDRLPNLINDSCGLCFTLKYLTLEQCTELCKTLCSKGQLDKLFLDEMELTNAAKILTESQYTVLKEALKDHLPTTMTLNEFLVLVTKIKDDEEKITLFFNTLEDRLPTLIKTREELREVLDALPASQRTPLAVLLGRKKLKPLLSGTRTSYSADLTQYRSDLLQAYQIIRENEAQKYFGCQYLGLFKWSRQQKLKAVANLINKNSEDAASKEGLLGAINQATGGICAT